MSGCRVRFLDRGWLPFRKPGREPRKTRFCLSRKGGEATATWGESTFGERRIGLGSFLKGSVLCNEQLRAVVTVSNGLFCRQVIFDNGVRVFCVRSIMTVSFSLL